MVKRKVIKIDQDKCVGCGACIPGCPEGALQMIDGKARLISDLFCDGLGACIGECPVGAIEVEEREAEEYSERKVMENIVLQGENTIRAHLDHLKSHGEMKLFDQAMEILKEKGIEIRVETPENKPSSPCGSGGCPGSRMMDMKKEPSVTAPHSGQDSELQNWPVQLKLLNPSAPYLRDADLLVCADCVPFAYPDFHGRFLKGKVVVTLCPKLDPYIQEYLQKLVHILENMNLKSITVLHMEVPCCSILSLVEQAVRASGKNVVIREYTISIKGEVI